MQIDIRATELLASKICHDLVSPVSAINNGVELIDDIGGSVVDEAMKLIGDSAAHAAKRLRLFRVAYGRAGSEGGLPVKEVRQIAEQYLSVGKTILHWPENAPAAELAGYPGFLKVVMNALILAEEVMAYGGTATLRDLSPDEGRGCRIEIVGRGAQLTDAFQAALAGTAAIDDLTPRTIQPYMVGRLAAHFGVNIRHDQPVVDRLDIFLTLPTTDVPSP